MSRLEGIVEKRKRKPRHPLVYVAIGVMVLLLVSGLGLAWRRLRSPVPGYQGPVTVAPQLISAVSVDLPQGDPAELSTPPAGESHTAVQDRPQAWTVRMEAGPEGIPVGMVSDQRVVEMVIEDYLEAYRWLYENVKPDPNEASRYFIDDAQRTGVLAATAIKKTLEEDQNRGVFFRLHLYDGQRNVVVSNFSPDGQSTYVSDSQRAQRLLRYYDGETLAVKEEIELPQGVFIATMVYDGQDRRWKIGHLEFIEMKLQGGEEGDE
ncbi:MAG TPA: hypothetical protein DCP08_06440 [Chloroflexi bacterium]|nr:hypothetical protein [Chloroflexota bacterium]